MAEPGRGSNANSGGRVSGEAGVERRAFLGGVGIAATALFADPAASQPTAAGRPVASTSDANRPQAAPAPIPMLVLDDGETAFLSAAVDLLIPASPGSPSASEACVVTFIDRQLASAWGGGAGTYRSGPFRRGTPEQGYQLPLTPRAWMAAGIAATNAWCAAKLGDAFDRLPAEKRLAALQQLEGGHAELDGVDGRAFFEDLLQLTMQGYFADPIYGGNAGLAGWRLLGFPGLPAFYGKAVLSHAGQRYVTEPKSIADFL